MSKPKESTDHTLVSVLIESGIADQQTIVGTLAQRHDGDQWLANQLVSSGAVSNEQMQAAIEMIEDLRSGNPFRVQKARVRLTRLRLGKLDACYDENKSAHEKLTRQARRISDQYPLIPAKVGSK